MALAVAISPAVLCLTALGPNDERTASTPMHKVRSARVHPPSCSARVTGSPQYLRSSDTTPRWRVLSSSHRQLVRRLTQRLGLRRRQWSRLEVRQGARVGNRRARGVFRSNSAQHAMGEGSFDTDLDKSLRKYYGIADSRGGRRAAFRILPGNRASTRTRASKDVRDRAAGSISHGKSTNNERHTCCTSRQTCALHSLPHLQALEAAGARTFFRAWRAATSRSIRCSTARRQRPARSSRPVP